jgi:hypothetical protein
MLTTITAIVGVVFGLSALVLSVLNYRRDRSKLLVSLRWDALTVRDTEGREAKFSQIYITNIGRRPIYITSAGLMFDPPRAWWFLNHEKQGKLRGRKLAEGDPPLSLVVDATRLGAKMTHDHRRSWREFRAFAIDSTGKRYLSKEVKDRPSWGVGDGRTPANATLAMEILECDLEQHDLESSLIKGDTVLLPLHMIDEFTKERAAAGETHPFESPTTDNGSNVVTTMGRTGRPSSIPPG